MKTNLVKTSVDGEIFVETGRIEISVDGEIFIEIYIGNHRRKVIRIIPPKDLMFISSYSPGSEEGYINYFFKIDKHQYEDVQI